MQFIVVWQCKSLNSFINTYTYQYVFVYKTSGIYIKHFSFHENELCESICFNSNIQVSGLFARDEMDEIINELIGPMKKEFPRRPPSNENLYEYYLSRCRQNLHLCLCFSPVSRFYTNRVNPLKYYITVNVIEDCKNNYNYLIFSSVNIITINIDQVKT